MDSDSEYSDDELDRLNDTIFLHPENPYVKPYICNQIIIYNGLPVIANDKIITMPKQYITLARNIENRSCWIRWLLLLQLLVIIPYCYTTIGVYYFITTCILGIITVSCCSNYNKYCMLLYICYNLTQLTIKIAFFCYMIYAIQHNTFFHILDINNTLKAYYIIGGQTIIICIDIPILLYMIQYYKILPTTTYFPNSIMI